MIVKPMMATMKQIIRNSIGGRPNTVLYPRERPVLPPRYRGKHVLSFTRCIGCAQCVKICPNECMWMKKLNDPELGKIQRPGVDYSRCLFCGLCVEICPTDALLMSGGYDHLPATERSSLLYEPEDFRIDDITVPEPKDSISIPALNFDKCEGKEQCAKICPVKCINIVEVEKTGKKKPEIELSVCTRCEKCAEVCPANAIEMKKKLVVMFDRPVPLFELDNCNGCGACFRICPTEAIYMAEMPGTERVMKDGKKGRPKKRTVFVLEKCIGCGRCVDSCRFDALKMVPEAQYKTEMEKKKKKGAKPE